MRYLLPPFVLLLTLALLPVSTEAQRLGIRDRSAPSWEGVEWLNLPDDVESLDVADLHGKVVYLFFFQSWCPGCHSHGFPTMAAVHDHYREETDVVFVAVQTVFEGFGTNTSFRAVDSLEEHGLSAIPVAHDAGAEEAGSVLMRRYRSGGTPWTVLIDRTGVVRFNGFQLEPEQGIRAIAAMLAGPR